LNITGSYPGIRVDTAAPHYQYSDPGLLEGWQHSQRFPGGAEIQKYARYVAEKWDLRKDTRFNTYIESAVWNSRTSSWYSTASNGSTYSAKFLVLCTGALVQQYTPKWKGIEEYKGLSYHGRKMTCILIESRNFLSPSLLASRGF